MSHLLLLQFSLFLFPRLILFLRFRYTVRLYLLFLVVQENDPYHLRQVHMPRVPPPSSSPATCFFLLRPLLDADASCRIHHPRSLCVRSLFYTLLFFLDIHITSNTTCIFYFYFYTFYFPLLSLFHSLVFPIPCFLNCFISSLSFFALFFVGSPLFFSYIYYASHFFLI